MAATEHGLLGIDRSTPSPSATSIAPIVKLCYLSRAKIFSLLTLSRLTFSELLSLVARAFPETQNGERPTITTQQSSVSRIELTYSDEGGDTVIINSEESFSLAALTFQETHREVIKLRISVKNDETSSGYFADAPKSASQASQNWRSRIPCGFGRSQIPCRYFRIGSCKFGSSCKFLHNVTDYPELANADSLADVESGIDEAEIDPMGASQASDNPPSRSLCRYFRTGSCKFGSLCRFLHNVTDYAELAEDDSLSDVEIKIDEWITTLRTFPEPDIISYLISPEGYNNFFFLLNYPSLPQIAFYQLASLLARPKLRTSLLKQATDKIYNALLGSQFLKAMHLHIRANVKPILGCIEPYVFLCEELMSRTSNGWKEVPLDELTLLVDEVKSDSAMELRHILASLHHRRLEAGVDGKMDNLSQEGSNFREMPIIPPKEQLLLQENPSPLPAVNQEDSEIPVSDYIWTPSTS